VKHGDKFTGINFGPLNMDLFEDRGTGMWANTETGVIAITEAVVSVERVGSSHSALSLLLHGNQWGKLTPRL